MMGCGYSYIVIESNILDQLEELRGCYAHYGPCSSCWVTCGIERSALPAGFTTNKDACVDGGAPVIADE